MPNTSTSLPASASLGVRRREEQLWLLASMQKMLLKLISFQEVTVTVPHTTGDLCTFLQNEAALQERVLPY